MRRALILGHGNLELIIAMSPLLVRAGFNVDLITANTALKKSKFISNCQIIHHYECVGLKAAERNLNSYDLIVICDDSVLKNIVNSKITLEEKLKLLPVVNEKNFHHLFSKIGLSQTLFQVGINTPPFFVANNLHQSIEQAEKLGFPVMVKIDASSPDFRTFPPIFCEIQLPIL